MLTLKAQLLATTFLLTALAASVAQVQDSRVPDSRAEDGQALRRSADDIRASADELFKLRKIPWVTDPAEGFRLARKENRPVFLYVQAGDPLEDC
jgi:hypothetical protein